MARDLITFQQNILVILTEEPMYGLVIKRHLEPYYNAEVNHGHLYPNLGGLVGVGLVKESELDKRTSRYKLTDDGLQVVLDRSNWMFTKSVIDDKRAEMISELVESKL